MRKLLLVFVAIVSALLLAATQSASARTAPARITDPASVPTFEQIASFGKPSPGTGPEQLIQGTDGALYGIATGGGLGCGTVFKMNPDNSGFTVLANFDGTTTGCSPHGKLVQVASGALYGTASGGGRNGFGTIFTLNTDGTGFQALVNFDEFSIGGVPMAGLVLGTDNVLYGTTSEGGLGTYGTVFRMNQDGSGFLILKNFSFNSTGGYPDAGLIQGTDGALYGTASQGGTGFNGTLFKLNTNGSGFTVLKSFEFNSATSGAVPQAGLMQGLDGALYGTASAGGRNGYGTLFRLNTNGTNFTVLMHLDGFATGAYPYGGLMQGTDFALYGTTTEGGSGEHGTVFKLNTNGTGFLVLKNFDYFTTGGLLRTTLLQGADGGIYGSAFEGGSGGGGGSTSGGTVYRLNTNGSGFAVLKDFPTYPNIPDGGLPYAGLVQGMGGALYGTTSTGGNSVSGTVFTLSPDGSGFGAVENLDFYTSGSTPSGTLTQGPDGALYGTATEGGVNVNGTVFKVLPHGGGLAVLKSFDGDREGTTPRAGVILGANGALYGTTWQGGLFGGGTLYRLNVDGSGFTVLLDFDGFTTGRNPSYGGLMQGTDGALYGTASNGGSMGYGTVFKLNPDGSGFTILETFDGAVSGGNPSGGLMQGADGALYGTTTQGGGEAHGTIFSLSRDGAVFTVLENLDGVTTGSAPIAGLVQGTDGALYGTTSSDGPGGAGTVFTLNPDGSGFNVLKSFGNLTNGGGPIGRLTWGADGNLYGTTYSGGEIGLGSVFRFVFAHGPCAGQADGAACDDGDACTTGDTCQAGTCVAGTPVTCSASDQCHDAGVCDHGTGICSNPTKSNGSACSDGNECTQVDTCQTGTCVGSSPVTCAALDQCHMPGTCNTMTGLCTNPARKDGTVCSDGNACTRSDTCQAGACAGGNPVICAVPDQCHTAGVCDTGTGICSSPARPDGSACSDADACTQIDSCQAGVCQGTNYSWSGVLAPINADGSSLFKLGSTVPVKFKLTGACDGRANVTAHLYVTKYSINIYGTQLEVLPKNRVDVGNTFRSDSSGNYNFNLDTGTLSRGTWQLRVDLGDGVPDRTVLISLK
ncbi:MAG TPA: choice-of-anchor tandem repeat GloVer-containing protein [Patescibacteria group bacterium]|nr:choice-of-anchor tandem repeat GloVer-containing protein [Patescibacteria group bacterium]